MLHTGAFNWTYTLGAGLCDPFANGATALSIQVGPGNMGQADRALAVTIIASVPGIYRQMLRRGLQRRVHASGTA